MHRTRWLLGALALLSLAVASLAGCGDGGGGGGVAGTYTLDLDATADAMAKAHPNATADTAKAAKEMTRVMFKDMEISMTLKGDKTWEGNFKGGPQTGVVKGTWSQDGDRVTFLAKEKAGKPAEAEDLKPKTGTLSGGVLTMEEGPMRIVLKKR